MSINKIDVLTAYKGKVNFSDCEYDENGDFMEIEQTLYSDYSGTTASKANERDFLKLFKHLEGVYEIIGHGCAGGVIIKCSLYENNIEGIKDLIDGLNEYPVIDDQTLSQIEAEVLDEAWDNWIMYDLTKELESRDIEYDESNEAALKDKFNKVCRENSIEIIYEYANSCFVKIEDVVNNWI